MSRGWTLSFKITTHYVLFLLSNPENTLADYLSSSSANNNVESAEKSAKLIELLKQLNAMNEIN